MWRGVRFGLTVSLCSTHSCSTLRLPLNQALATHAKSLTTHAKLMMNWRYRQADFGELPLLAGSRHKPWQMQHYPFESHLSEAISRNACCARKKAPSS